jgi:hypothetical protein
MKGKKVMKEQFDENLRVLAHSTELAARVIGKVIGDEVSNVSQGIVMNDKEIKSVVAAKLQTNLIKKAGRASK